GDAANIRASRIKTGPFEPLRSFPEFRDLVVTPVPLSVPRNTPSSSSTETPTVRQASVNSAPQPSTPEASPQRASVPPEEERKPHIDLAGPVSNLWNQ